MAKFVINEVAPGSPFASMPNTNVTVDEAHKYEERGSYTVFLDAEGQVVFSFRTTEVNSIRKA